MILGNSMDAKSVHVYRNTEEPFDIIELNWVDGDYMNDESGYELVEQKDIPYIEEDGWHRAVGFNSDDIKLLIECDYCSRKFVLSQSRRDNRESSFRSTCNNSGVQMNYGESSVYKDNCKRCKIKKIRETTMITKGYFHPAETEEFKQMMREVHKDSGFVKSSRGQRYIAKLLDAELNVLVDYYYADIVIDNKIVIEYDGGGHNLSVHHGNMTQEKFDANERKRSGYLFSKGYKIVRFISPQELFPENEEITKEILSEAISRLYLTEQREVSINLGTKVNDPIYGKLRPIKRILESSEWGEDIL